LVRDRSRNARARSVCGEREGFIMLPNVFKLRYFGYIIICEEHSTFIIDTHRCASLLNRPRRCLQHGRPAAVRALRAATGWRRHARVLSRRGLLLSHLIAVGAEYSYCKDFEKARQNIKVKIFSLYKNYRTPRAYYFLPFSPKKLEKRFLKNGPPEARVPAPNPLAPYR